MPPTMLLTLASAIGCWSVQASKRQVVHNRQTVVQGISHEGDRQGTVQQATNKII